MVLLINGKNQTVTLTSATLNALLTHLSVAENRGVAVALNDRVVPKSMWETTTLSDNDRIEIISPFQGG